MYIKWLPVAKSAMKKTNKGCEREGFGGLLQIRWSVELSEMIVDSKLA